MNPEDIIFEEFFAERMKQKGMTPKKLAEITGISQRHVQDIANGDFSHLPSAPYVRGYLIRLGEILEFEGDPWWQKIKREGRIKNSGIGDALPGNRFMRKSPVKLIAIFAIALIVLIYAIIEFPNIIGKPALAVTSPATNPVTVTSNLVTLEGTAENADSLSINGEAVTIAADGTWQKEVLLPSAGINTFQITAKKFLGRTADIMEEIVYEPSNTPPASASLENTPSTTQSSTVSSTSTSTL